MTGFSSVSLKQWLCSFAFFNFKYVQCPRHLQPSGTTKAGSSGFCENLWGLISRWSISAWEVQGAVTLWRTDSDLAAAAQPFFTALYVECVFPSLCSSVCAREGEVFTGCPVYACCSGAVLCNGADSEWQSMCFVFSIFSFKATYSFNYALWEVENGSVFLN